MNIERIKKYFSDDYELSKGDLLDVEELLGKYPFFEALRFVYLKSWYNIKYDKFKEELNKMAVFVSNREALFYYIFRENFNYLLTSKRTTLSSDKTLELINAFFETDKHLSTPQKELDSVTQGLAHTDYLAFVDKIESKKSEAKNKPERINISNEYITLETIVKDADTETKPTESSTAKYPAQSDRKETNKEPLISIEIVNKTSKQDANKKETEISDIEGEETGPLISIESNTSKQQDQRNIDLQKDVINEEDINSIGSEEMSTLITNRLEESLRLLKELNKKEMTEAQKKEAIIDNFLSKDVKSLGKLNKADIINDSDEYIIEEESEEENELDNVGFFTETLAKIYIKQGRYEKAYEIIKHLSLKVSNKNTYFAEQLSYLEKLIINKKTNKK